MIRFYKWRVWNIQKGHSCSSLTTIHQPATVSQMMTFHLIPVGSTETYLSVWVTSKKVSHKKETRGCVFSCSSIFVRTSLNCKEVLAISLFFRSLFLGKNLSLESKSGSWLGWDLKLRWFRSVWNKLVYSLRLYLQVQLHKWLQRKDAFENNIIL